MTSTITRTDLIHDTNTPRRRLIEIGRQYHARAWSLGTSSNYSVVLDRDPLRLLITASGKHKDRLGPDDFVIVNERGETVEDPPGHPSAETLLHTVIAQRIGAGAVLHTHSVWSTLLSQRFSGADGDGEMMLQDYEMLKGLRGVTTHEQRVRIPIFDNTQNMEALAGRLERCFDNDATAPTHAFLLRRHGLYTWGRDLDEARRHVEILEFLLEAVGRETALSEPPALPRDGLDIAPQSPGRAGG